MTRKENFKAQEDFTAYLNRKVLFSCEYYRLVNPDEVKKLLKQMTDKFREIYGADKLTADMEFVLVPAVIKPKRYDGLYAAIVQLDLTSSGEHYGTDFFTQYGLINTDMENKQAIDCEFLRSAIPYDYYPTVPYPGDIHINWDNCPADVREIINYCRNNSSEQTGGISLT